ncbi:deoxycytidylate deaminase, partial [Acinetobacter baumannii]|nr:deoxycytidylate deaminase [Acinetobacter baumannii]
MLEKIQETSNEVVIALVGAVGSSLTPLTNITKSLLEAEFNYEVEVIKISKDILSKYFSSTFIINNASDRINAYMDKGNELRRSKGNDFLALLASTEIHKKRQEWLKNNPGKKSSIRRVAYIIDSLKHEDEVQA